MVVGVLLFRLRSCRAEANSQALSLKIAVTRNNKGASYVSHNGTPIHFLQSVLSNFEDPLGREFGLEAPKNKNCRFHACKGYGLER